MQFCVMSGEVTCFEGIASAHIVWCIGDDIVSVLGDHHDMHIGSEGYLSLRPRVPLSYHQQRPLLLYETDDWFERSDDWIAAYFQRRVWCNTIDAWLQLWKKRCCGASLRRASDGMWYTRQEFKVWYGLADWSEFWRNAPVVEGMWFARQEFEGMGLLVGASASTIQRVQFDA